MRRVLLASFAFVVALFGAPGGSPMSAMLPALAIEDSHEANTKAKGAQQFTGMADYYHHSLYGRKTASGQVLAKHLFTAAHRTLPFGTHVHVKNHSNGRSCIVVINDRGPFTKSKVIDLSHSAATELAMISAGTCKVGCTVVAKPESLATKPVIVAIKPSKVVPKSDALMVNVDEKIVSRQAIAMKPVKENSVAVNNAKTTRADESSADLEGAEPINWTEVQ